MTTPTNERDALAIAREVLAEIVKADESALTELIKMGHRVPEPMLTAKARHAIAVIDAAPLEEEKQEPVILEAVAEIVRADGFKSINWLVEGSESAFEVGDLLFATASNIANCNGVAELYIHPSSTTALVARNEALEGWQWVPVEPDKATFIGEFSMDVKHHCSACAFHGAQDDCEVCGGEVEYTQKHTIPWTLFKEMYAAMLAASPKKEG